MQPTKIILPLPPRELQPNSRAVWQARARLTKKARADGYIAARVAWGNGRPPRWHVARITVTFYFARTNRRDPDNLIAWLKPYIDGLEDFGLIDDDTNLLWGDVKHSVDKSDPRVELEVVPE